MSGLVKFSFSLCLTVTSMLNLTLPIPNVQGSACMSRQGWTLFRGAASRTWSCCPRVQASWWPQLTADSCSSHSRSGLPAAGDQSLLISSKVPCLLDICCQMHSELATIQPPSEAAVRLPHCRTRGCLKQAASSPCHALLPGAPCS